MTQSEKRPSPRARRLLLAGAGAALLLALLLLLVGRADHYDRWAFFGRFPRKWVFLTGCFCWLAVGLLCAARSRRTLFGFVFANILGAFGLGLIEVAGVFGLAKPKAAWTGLGYVATPNLDVKTETHGNLVPYLKLEPSSYSIHYRTDARGYRCEKDHPAEDVRVWCVGDSFVVAGLVGWKKTITARLQAGLSAKVANVALTGTGPPRQRDLFRAVDPPLEGRLVIQFVFEGNDLKDSARERKTKGQPKPHRLLTVRAIDWVRDATLPPPKRWGTFANRRYHFFEASGKVGGELAHVVAALSEMRDSVEAGGGRYGVAFFPTKLRAMGSATSWPEDSALRGYGEESVGPFPKLLAEALAKAKIPFLDLTPALSAAAARGVEAWFTDDSHLNGKGHEVSTRALLDWDVVRRWKKAEK